MTTKKRRQFWIDPPVQAHMLLTVLALVTASVILVSYSIAKGVETAWSQSGQLFQPMSWVAGSMRFPMALSMAVSILASALIALVWSHRFAGPLRVLAAAMERLRAGDFGANVRVRDNDTLKEIVDEFAVMQASLRERAAADRERAQALGSRIAGIAAGLPEDHPARNKLHDLAEEARRIGAGYRL